MAKLMIVLNVIKDSRFSHVSGNFRAAQITILMKKSCLRFAMYVLFAILFPVLLWYPAMMYLDLAGMGGYSGFANVSMMETHGCWSSSDSHTVVYYAFHVIYVFWCGSLIHLPVTFVLIFIKC